ncbi:MAG: class I SAM-dependent methyltransferase [Candidatus Dormibacteria bacterium]
MEEGLRGPSRTALMAAMGRALHRNGSSPHILDDWLASDLAGDEGRVILDNMRATVTADRLAAFQAWTAARSRFVEDFIVDAAASGVRQCVVLGAGLDSFAYRHVDLLERLTVFEVDHPLSQAWKQRLLHELQVELPRNLVFAAIDFEAEALGESLSAFGFEARELAVISWIGVTMYLTHEAINATLSSVSRFAPGTRLVLSFDQPSNVLDPPGRALLADVRRTAATLGEPFISLFTRDEIERLLLSHGFNQVTHFGADDAQGRYFCARDMRMPDVQRLATALVASTHVGPARTPADRPARRRRRDYR